MTREQNKLTNLAKYDVNERLIFKKHIESIMVKSNPPIKSHIVPIATKNLDGSIGDLLIKTPPRLFSFGISENKSLETGKVIGHSLPLCCWNIEGPTEEERNWTTKFDEIYRKARAHIEKNPDLLLNENRLVVKCPLYWKKDKDTKKIVEGKGPVLYPKLIEQKSGDNVNIQTIFYTDSGDIDPMSLLGTKCRVTGVIKVESIRIAATAVTIQIKLYEAKIELLNNAIRRLLVEDDDGSSVTENAGGNIYNSLLEDNSDGDSSSDSDGDGDGGNDNKPNILQLPQEPEPKKGRVVQRVKKTGR